jgi:hypothetical protein
MSMFVLLHTQRIPHLQCRLGARVLSHTSEPYCGENRQFGGQACGVRMQPFRVLCLFAQRPEAQKHDFAKSPGTGRY